MDDRPGLQPHGHYTGQSNTTYAFYSIAHDLAGNTENKKPLIEASTYVPNLTPPVTIGRSDDRNQSQHGQHLNRHVHAQCHRH